MDGSETKPPTGIQGAMTNSEPFSDVAPVDGALGVCHTNDSERTLPGFYFLCVLWGRHFAALFAEITVASLLAPGNIPAIRNKTDSRLVLCTSPDDWNYLTSLRIVQKLQRHIRIHFIDIGDRYFYSKYHKMGHGHRKLTDFAFTERKIAIHINPDTLVPDGSVAAVQCLAQRGVNLVLCPAVRFDQDGIMDELKGRGHIAPDHPIALSMREAADLGIRHLHIETRAGNWDAANFGQLHPQHLVDHFPICCYFEVPGENGLVMYGHNWAPFMMNYASLREHKTGSFDNWTIDGVYAFENFGGQELGKEIHVVRDSDELFLLGMTPAEEMSFVPQSRWWKTAPVIGRWSKGYELNGVLHVKWMDDFRRRIYPVFARWHAGKISRRWDATERRAARIVAEYAGPCLLPRHHLRRLKGPADWLQFAFSTNLPRLLWYVAFFGSRPAVDHGALVRKTRGRLTTVASLALNALRGDASARHRIRVRLHKLIFKESF
jgi:hypothetical protein